MIDQLIQAYCDNHTTQETGLLAELNRETHAKVLQPRMLSGHFQGRFLSLLSKLARPSLILEIGTFTGYSALCLAEGLVPGGRLITIDVNEELEQFTRNYFNKSPYAQQIDYIIGNARDIIPTLTDLRIDLVFIDADKQSYQQYYDLVKPLMNKGGLIIADNILWDGKVPDPQYKDKKTTHLRDFNLNAHTDSQTENILLPIRDGLMISRII
ncbi:MAG: O-methyltransferase [Spirosomataceae bacterium]